MIIAKAKQAGQERNTARVTGANRDPDLSNNQSSAETYILGRHQTPNAPTSGHWPDAMGPFDPHRGYRAGGFGDAAPLRRSRGRGLRLAAILSAVNPTVLGAIIGVGGSTAAQTVAGYFSTRRHGLRLNEGRLRELARVIDAADGALTKTHHHLGSAGRLAQEVGAHGASSEDRWEGPRQRAKDRAVEDLDVLWSHENLLRLRVSDEHPLLAVCRGN